MTRQQQVIEKLQTFVFDPKAITELKNFDVSQREQAQDFIIKVQKLMNKSRRWAFNDWNYGDYIVIGELLAEFGRWLLNWYLPFNERSVENQRGQWAILLVGISIAISGIYRQSNYRASVWSGIEEVDKLLLQVHSSPEMAHWWEKRMQKEIIGMFSRAQLEVKELEKLASRSSSQLELFSQVANQLLPQFGVNTRDMAISLKWIMRGTAVVFLCAGYPFFISFFNATGKFSNSSFTAVGVFMVLFIQGKKSAAAAEYGGERAVQWEGRKMQWLLRHLQNNPDDEEKTVRRKKVEKKNIIEEKIKLGRLASAKKLKNDKKKTCKKALINTAALLFNMATAFPGFCLNTMRALFPQSLHRERAVAPDEKLSVKAAPPKKSAQFTRKNLPRKTKNPGNSRQTPFKSTQPLSTASICNEGEDVSLQCRRPADKPRDNELKLTPTDTSLFPSCDPLSCGESFLPRQLPFTAQPNDEVIESGLPLPSVVDSVEEIKTMETLSASSDNKTDVALTEPPPSDQFRIVTVTTPAFFGGQTFEVKMTNANAHEWETMNFSPTEQLAILRSTHDLLCRQATRNFFETAQLRDCIRVMEQKNEKVFFQGIMAPRLPTSQTVGQPNEQTVRNEQHQHQLLGKGN